MKNTGRLIRGNTSFDDSSKKRIETKWIKSLGTVYSYRLNGQVEDDYRNRKTEWLKFPSWTRTHSRTREIQYNYVNNIYAN